MKIDYRKLHELSFLNRKDLYKDKDNINFDNFSTRLGEIENDPFIGFVGSRYADAKVRVLFLGKSNAESIKSEHQDKDIRINQYLHNFRNSTENFESRYKEYARQFSDKSSGAFATWDINQYSVYFRNITRLDVEEIAYANIVPFRYIGAPERYKIIDGKRRVYEIAFESFTNKFIDIVKPHQIIPLGVNLPEDAINRFIDKKDLDIKISDGIFRLVGDSKMKDEGKRTLNNAIQDYEAKLAELEQKDV